MPHNSLILIWLPLWWSQPSQQQTAIQGHQQSTSFSMPCVWLGLKGITEISLILLRKERGKGFVIVVFCHALAIQIWLCPTSGDILRNYNAAKDGLRDWVSLVKSLNWACQEQHITTCSTAVHHFSSANKSLAYINTQSIQLGKLSRTHMGLSALRPRHRKFAVENLRGTM